MSLHILIIGNRASGREPSDVLMDQIAASIVPSENFLMSRCDRPEDLIGTISDLAQGRMVDILDIFDHGHAGSQRLGSDILFRSDGDYRSSLLKGESLAQGLVTLLSNVAQLRLLGCGTSALNNSNANSAAGRALLCKLARTLGGRRSVFGTIRAVNQRAFAESGFRQDVEIDYLFSSWAAVDDEPPDFDKRIKNVGEISPLQAWEIRSMGS